MNDSTKNQWYLLTSKPHKDAIAEQQLINQGYEVYRPLATRLKKRRGKMIRTTESLFPRYLFISLNSYDSNWVPIRSTIGVNRIIEFGGKPAVVPNKLINFLQKEEANFGALAIDLDKFHRDDQIIITDGPFKGLNGKFLSYDSDERAVVLLEIMNNVTKLPISPANLMAA